jgi:hypothetical protein
MFVGKFKRHMEDAKAALKTKASENHNKKGTSALVAFSGGLSSRSVEFRV